jgi:hypothetical protein
MTRAIARAILGPKKSRAPRKVEILCKGTILNPWNGPFSDFQRVYFIRSHHIYSTGTLVISCHLFSTLFWGLFLVFGMITPPPPTTHVGLICRRRGGGGGNRISWVHTCCGVEGWGVEGGGGVSCFLQPHWSGHRLNLQFCQWHWVSQRRILNVLWEI